jgi:uncharacterized membrane protein
MAVEQVEQAVERLDPQRVARGLGWFSVGLGLAEVAAPGALATLIGVPERRGLLRLLGVREIASGLGILTQRRPAGWLWSRVAGDAMDLALLGMAFRAEGSAKGRVAAATAAVGAVAALDAAAARELAGGAPLRVRRSVTVNRPVEEIYGFWRRLENLPRVMRHLEAVQSTGDGRSHWVAKGPAGRRVEWDAEIVEDQPNARIAWRSVEGAQVSNAGVVQFRPGPGARGTRVTVELEYAPPGGALGALVAKLFGEAPEQQLYEDLRRFKQVMETGEVVSNEGPSGRRWRGAEA